VEVKGPSEILATLDTRGALQDLPFMPEMAAFCGKRFTVERRAERVCDTVHYSGSRRPSESVFLADLRCDGSAHDGCQAECRFVWKEAWLRKVQPESPLTPPISQGDLQPLIDLTTRSARHAADVDGSRQERWRCQATELPRASEHLKLWDPGPIREYTSGNVTLGHPAGRGACQSWSRSASSASCPRCT
jgi:hypothetical protein